jgi:hypothetical protein
MKKKVLKLEDITFEKAYNSLPNDDEDVVNYDKAKAAGMADHSMAELELIIITKVANPPDYNADMDDFSIPKWTPVFRYGQKGFRFLYSRYLYTYSDPALGSRLCLFNQSTANHMGKTFEATYKRFLIK